MFHSLPTHWLAVIASMASVHALGQPLAVDAKTLPPRADPTFRSALDGYQPFKDEKRIPWKEANETVYRRGGWQAYAREASDSGAVRADSTETGESAPFEQSGRSRLMPAMPDMPDMPDMANMPATKDKP